MSRSRCKTPGVRQGWPTSNFGVDPGDGRTVKAYATFLRSQGLSLATLVESLGGPSEMFSSFEEARTFVRGLGLKSSTEWYEWNKSGERPAQIPAAPHTYYKDKGWLDWGDWLGTGTPSSNKTFRSFEEARTFVRAQKLDGFDAWCKWRTSERPEDIPSNPAQIYENDGWVGYPDWLGCGSSFKAKAGWPFKKARAFARSLKLGSKSEWGIYAKSSERPKEIPCTPNEVYRDAGWISWGDWLGTGYAATKPYSGTLRPFAAARRWARSLNLPGLVAWKAWLRVNDRPEGVPATPSKVYADDGWAGWGDWLGTGNLWARDRKFRSFTSARKFARGLGLKNRRAWSAWASTDARPTDIPAVPSAVYVTAGWAGYGDWLGMNRRSKVTWARPFRKARAFARSLDLHSRDEWMEWCASDARPDDIPVSPGSTYSQKGWDGWGDWLGTGTVAVHKKTFRPFRMAREYVRSLGLRSEEEWRAWSKTKRPGDIPSTPAMIYRDSGWRGMADWLGASSRQAAA